MIKLPDFLPDFLKQYFWDVDFLKLNPEKKPEYIIERLLEFGDIQALRWMIGYFPIEIIKGVIRRSRALSKKSASYWSLILDIPESEIRCLQQDFQKTHRAIWPY